MRRPDRAAWTALVVALPALPWLIDAAWRASFAALGRDQGIFQYVAWAASRGEVLYRDVRDVNGPLVAMIHLALQELGGEDAHRFRTLDLVFTAATFAFAGACVPSLASRAVRARERAAWAMAALVVLLAQYLGYGFWDTAQRESFFDWFLSVAIGALLVGQARPAADRRALAWLALSGACALAPVLGKPTYALFVLANAGVILVDPGGGSRGRRLAAFSAGASASALAIGAFLVARGDARAYLRIALVDVPAMYRFIWPRTPGAIVSTPGYATTTALALVVTIAGIALVVRGKLPRRALAVAVVPVLGIGSVLVQAKGFPYHFHPVTFGIGLGAIALAFLASERGPRWAAVALGAALGARALFGARAAGELARQEEAARWERVDYFPDDLAAAARSIAETTGPDERVQTYGMDAYVLFLAKRRSASPYIYAYDLNADAALAGSFDDGGPRPSAAERARIRAMRDAHERDLLAHVEAHPPAAFVFVDRSPLMSSRDAVADFESHCHTTATFVLERYEKASEFGVVRVWKRSDLR